MSDTGKYMLAGCAPVHEPDAIRWARWFEGADALRVVARSPMPCGALGHEALTFFMALAGPAERLEGGPPSLFETVLLDPGSGTGGVLDWCALPIRRRGYTARTFVATPTWELAERVHTFLLVSARHAATEPNAPTCVCDYMLDRAELAGRAMGKTRS